MKSLKGIGASSGVAIAKVFKLEKLHIDIKKTIGVPKEEIEKFDKAVKDSIIQIEKVKENALKNLGEEEAQVFDAHIQVASDPMIADEVKALINDEKFTAIFATNEITNKYAEMFSSMDDAYMKERAADVKDVAKRIINNLAGVKGVDITAIDEEVIIVAEDLTPSDTAQLNKEFVKGFATKIGGRTSHSAIMARSLEIPAVLGLGEVLDKVTNEDVLIINGETGDVIINPSDTEIETAKKKIEEETKEKEELKKFIGKESITKDGHHVELGANVGSPNDLEGALENDAQAIGLFRSEFLYMDAKDWPTEEEQFENYKKVIQGMKSKLVVIRTLDIGGDKILDYFEFPEEMNPFLGYRAIRLSLDKKDIFQTQLRALIRAAKFGKLGIMFPMIATIDEFKESKEEFVKAYDDLAKEGYDIPAKEDIQIGMMVEIPAAAVNAEKFANYADFFSIGTNDLMQYTMAADRMSEKVSYLYQPLNPSILGLIKMTIDGAHSKGKWVGMCGEMAGDANAIPILLGLGLDEFSMSATSILKARKQLSEINLKDSQELAKNAIKSETQDCVKKLLNDFNNKK